MVLYMLERAEKKKILIEILMQCSVPRDCPKHHMVHRQLITAPSRDFTLRAQNVFWSGLVQGAAAHSA